MHRPIVEQLTIEVIDQQVRQLCAEEQARVDCRCDDRFRRPPRISLYEIYGRLHRDRLVLLLPDT